MKPCIPDLLPIDLDWGSLVEHISQATIGVARYDGTLDGILNPAVLLSPVTAKEAVLSSKIEGTQATLIEVLEHEAGEEFEEEKEKDIQEIINYRRALLVAEKYLADRSLSLSLLRELHDILMDSVRGKDKNPGAFRTDQNWIGKPGCSIDEARFVPPNYQTMLSSLDNLEKFIGDDYKDPLVQLAIIHAQFEIIHPFNDGNGRLGRMLIPLFLYQKKVLQRPVFYLSEYLEKNDDEYRDRLLSVTKDGDWQEWILFFLNAIKIQSEINIKKAKMIHDLYERMKIAFSETTGSKYSLQVLDTFFSKPIINTTDFFKRSQISTTTTAFNILKSLEDAEIIRKLRQGRGQLPTLYVFPELINISEGKNVY